MIDKEKKYSISEVSKLTGYDTHVLRYYESDFNLVIPRTKSNRRYYTSLEIERFIYIRDLQEKGLTNKQIKQILESPEILLQDMGEVAITKVEYPMDTAVSQRDMMNMETQDYEDVIHNICENINNTINTNLNVKLDETKQEIIERLDRLTKDKEVNEDGELIDKEKDVLLCENARLKMKLKEKSYEIAELKDKVKRMDQNKGSFWKRVFS